MYVRMNNRVRSVWYSGPVRGYDPVEMCWEDLAQAVILSAVKEYRRALKCLRINPENREWIRKKTECERFFRSWWFGVLTDADPAVILDGLKKEAAV